MKIIAIGHYRRVGKDTFANFLKEKLLQINPRLRVGKRSWAWKLKQICHELYAWAGLREADFYETEPGASLREVVLPAIGKSPRQIWIDMGTPAVREQVYDRTWLDFLLKNEQQLDVMLIPDTRFFNEADGVLDEGGELLKIVRPGYGPGPNKPDRQLLGYSRFTNVIGETGLLSDLEAWADRYAHWLCGGEKPTRTEEEMQRALEVEVVEPWADPDIGSNGYVWDTSKGEPSEPYAVDIEIDFAEPRDPMWTFGSTIDWWKSADLDTRWKFLMATGAQSIIPKNLAYVYPEGTAA